MSWPSLVLKNSLRNGRRFLGFLLASGAAVLVFTMFGMFVLNPSVREGAMPSAARMLLLACQIIVALFAIFFIGYFHAALLRARSQEFGLFQTLGVTRGQIARMILLESALMGGIALAAGLAGGIGASALFLRAMGAILDLPDAIPFVVPRGVILSAVLFFGVVLVTDAVVAATRVAWRTPRAQFLGGRTRQGPPRASIALVIVGVGCVALGYVLAVGFSRAIIATMFPILILTGIGTYLLFNQALVFVLRAMQRRAPGGTSLLIVSRLAYRVRDHARMLTLVALLSAMVISGMAGAVGLLRLIRDEATRLNPFAVQLMRNEARPVDLTPDDVSRALAAEGLSIESAADIAVVTGDLALPRSSLPVSVTGYADYARLRDALLSIYPDRRDDLPAAAPTDGAAYLFVPDEAASNPSLSEDVSVQIGSTAVPVRSEFRYTTLLNYQPDAISNWLLVVPDSVFADLSAAAPEENRWRLHSYGVTEWQETWPAIVAMERELPPSDRRFLADTVTLAREARQISSVLLFAGFFLSALFFLAAGCALYFKLFMQVEEDRRQFRALQRVGLRVREATRVVTTELAILFFIPVGVAIVHSAMAVASLSNMLSAPGSVWPAFLMVALLYLASFAAYMLVARGRYLRQVR